MFDLLICLSMHFFVYVGFLLTSCISIVLQCSRLSMIVFATLDSTVVLSLSMATIWMSCLYSSM